MKNSFLVAALMLGVSCSSMVDKVQKDQLTQIKKIAIVGFTYDRAEPTSAGSILSNLMGGSEMEGNLDTAPRESNHADHAYGLVSSKLAERLQVQVLPQAEVAANPLIKNYYLKKNAAVQMGVMPLAKNWERLEAKGIPQTYYVKRQESEVVEMCKALGVDGVVFLNVSSHIDRPGWWRLYIGRNGSESDVSVVLFNSRGKNYPLVLNQRGDTFKMGDVTFGGIEEKEETHTKAYKSFESALDKLAERI